MEHKVLDHGYIRFVEDWGRGDAGEPEAGIIEAARQSTQGSFRGWEEQECQECAGTGYRADQLARKEAYTFKRLDNGLIAYFDEQGREIGIKTIGGPCSNCQGKKTIPGDERLLKFLYSGKPQHATPFEFCGMVIEVQAPLMVFREWHRHRTQSYNEMSARYAPMPDMNYLPSAERCLMVSAANKQAGSVKGSDEITKESANQWLTGLGSFYALAEKLYQDGLAAGMPKELARLCIPVGRYSRMRASANLRNWLAFMTLRSDPAAQWEIRQFSYALGDIIAQRFPHTWKLYIENGGAYREQR